MRLVSSIPTREKPMMRSGDLEGGVEEQVGGDDARDEPDAPGLGGVHVAAGQHDLEGA